MKAFHLVKIKTGFLKAVPRLQEANHDLHKRFTVDAIGGGAGVDNAWDHGKLYAIKLPLNSAEFPHSSAS